MNETNVRVRQVPKGVMREAAQLPMDEAVEHIQRHFGLTQLDKFKKAWEMKQNGASTNQIATAFGFHFRKAEHAWKAGRAIEREAAKLQDDRH